MLIIFGRADSGKSTTLRLAFEKFLYWAVKSKSGVTVEYLYITEKDVAAVIKFEKISIGIVSRGDTGKQVNEGLNFFKKHKCKIVVCATRTKGGSLVAARSPTFKCLGAPHEEWSKPRIMPDFEEANENYAKQIVKWVKKTINA